MAIGLNIGGEAISATAVRDSLDDLLALLSDASRATGSGVQEWTIADLRIGSAIMAVQAPDEQPVAALIREGLATLGRVAEIPSGWSRRMVERIIALGGRAGRGGATQVNLTGLGAEMALTAAIVDHATRALGAATVSYGSFRGHVDRWNEHGRHEIGIALDGEGRMTVSYPSSLADRVRSEAIGRRIEAWGLVSRNPVGQATGLAMDDFEVLVERRAIPVAEVAGIFADENGEPWFRLDEWLETRGD